MAFLKEKPHFITALLLCLTGIEGLLWLGLFLPKQQDFLSGDAGVFIFLAIWALAAIFLLLLGLSALFGQKWAQRLIANFKVAFSPATRYSRWVVPGLLACYLGISTVVILVWGANNTFLNQVAEPLGRWFFLAALQALLVGLFIKEFPASWHTRKTFALVLAIIAFVWISVISTRVGLEPDNRFWNVAGVPVLINQLALVLGLALFGIFLYGLLTRKASGNPRRREILLDILACLILWAGAAWFWHQAPFSNSFFAEGVFPPNQDFYPYSDAALTDLGGQYMLIGKGLEYPYFTEKPLYALFLGLLHRVVGQRYFTVTSWQMICFEVFPSCCICSETTSQSLVWPLNCTFSVAKEYNAIFSTFKISVSNSRLYLSEFPTMILMALLAIALVGWFKSTENLTHGHCLQAARWAWRPWCTNPLLLVPVIIVLALWHYRRDLKTWTSVLLFICESFW